MRPRINVKFIDLSGLRAMLLLAGVDVASDVSVSWSRGPACFMGRQTTIPAGFRLSHRFYDPV